MHRKPIKGECSSSLRAILEFLWAVLLILTETTGVWMLGDERCSCSSTLCLINGSVNLFIQGFRLERMDCEGGADNYLPTAQTW